ncbi:macrolide export protein MacA [mine drainage metagenome]|uniref:Macrolide export protein MacA n=1 Tax=mine drainage metagenome TaxID=410659 RepID=A0A1J5RTP0_9ZZZZ
MKLSLSRRTGFILGGAVLLAAFAWVATRSGPFAPIKVTVTRVAKGTVAPTLFGIGTVEARRAYLIGPTGAGRVARVLVDVGDQVSAGQLLATMDPVDLDQRLASAAAAAERGRSAVATAQAQADDAKSRQALAASEAARYVDLGKKHFVSQSVVDAKLQQEQSADDQLTAAQSALTSARQDLTRLTAERGAALRQRDNLRLQSPADAVVTSRDAEPGSTVIAGQSVLKLEDPASLWVTVRLDQGRSAGLRVGLPADIVLRSNPGKTLAGKVVRIEPVSDSVTEERIAEVAFDKLPPLLSSNEMADVTVHLPSVAAALVVPNAALRSHGAQAGVWRYADGRLRFTPVQTGAAGLDGKTQIVAGLKAGDEVVVYSERDLQEGSRIQVVAALVASPAAP